MGDSAGKSWKTKYKGERGQQNVNVTILLMGL